MLVISVDYHPSVQQIVFTDIETGELWDRTLCATLPNGH